jgi:hypothetical protein
MVEPDRLDDLGPRGRSLWGLSADLPDQTLEPIAAVVVPEVGVCPFSKEVWKRFGTGTSREQDRDHQNFALDPMG